MKRYRTWIIGTLAVVEHSALLYWLVWGPLTLAREYPAKTDVPYYIFAIPVGIWITGVCLLGAKYVAVMIDVVRPDKRAQFYADIWIAVAICPLVSFAGLSAACVPGGMICSVMPFYFVQRKYLRPESGNWNSIDRTPSPSNYP